MQRLNDTTQASTEGDGTHTVQQTGQERGGRREKEKDGSPIPNINSASPRKELLSQATDCPLKSLVYLVSPSLRGAEITFRSFQGILFLHKVTITGFNLNTGRDNKV